MLEIGGLGGSSVWSYFNERASGETVNLISSAILITLVAVCSIAFL